MLAIPMELSCESFVVVEWADPGAHPGRPIAALHVHHDDDEAWYVLEGRLGLQLGHERVEIGAGDGVLAPRGTPHSYWNAHAAPTRYLLVLTPRLRSLVEALHAVGRSDYATIFHEHRSELLG
jgi:mannose-6-phosphate isomerase-like protein (cupin superfamily)